MPENVVHTKVQEKAWSKAKMLARKQYPNVSEDSDRYWSIVMGIYKKMVGYKPKHKTK